MKKLTWKIWLLIIVLALSLLSIFGMPPTFFQKGVLVASVTSNSTAFEQGLKQGQIIIGIDGQSITSLEDFSNVLEGKYDSRENIKTIINTKDSEIILFSNQAPEIIVSEIPKTNIKTGLDLAGGARALVQAEGKKLTSLELTDLVDITSNRLNEFGLTDLRVVPVSDLAGNNFMLIEIAGATPDDLEKLISEQGKFEAKIGNETVFIGGERDISSVARSGQESGIYSCDEGQGSHFCNFRFTIYLSEDAAKRHAEITDELGVNATPQGNYLDQKLDLLLDDKLVSSLLISEGLKGRVTTQISISGSESGATRDEAITNAEQEMKQLQTILITGSLPFKLEIVKLDTISPLLGKEFIKSIFLAGFAALIAVSVVIFFRYKKFKSSIALLFTSISEVIIILGIASLIRWNLDLPSIAGILATIGTGIDQQIIILDEARQSMSLSIKQRLRRAFSIILGAYFTAVVALLPLMWAGAGLLKGFAVTTLIGITAGVLITRPAFTDMVRMIEE
ncbi:PDZ domain-containing protein [Candidatus Pacearchaeota archaeon]|nr:PDZ domain-containing protein [Candidatus Pacearchaeota archaeon]